MKREKVRDLIVSAIADSDKLTEVVDALFNAIKKNRITDEPLTIEMVTSLGFIYDSDCDNWSMPIKGESPYQHIIMINNDESLSYLRECKEGSPWSELKTIEDLLENIEEN